MPKLILNGNTLGVNIDEFKGATSSANGTNGVVPKPLAGEQEHFLKADGTWSNTFGETRVSTTSDPICRDVDDSYMIFRACTKSQPNGGAILLGGQGNATYPGVFSIFARDHGGTSGAARSVALLGKPDGTLTWGGQDVMRRNTTFTGATSSAAGKAGVVPAPAAGGQYKYLRGDATWQTLSIPNPTLTTASYSTNWGTARNADTWYKHGISLSLTAGTYIINATYQTTHASTAIGAYACILIDGESTPTISKSNNTEMSPIPGYACTWANGAKVASLNMTRLVTLTATKNIYLYHASTINAHHEGGATMQAIKLK